MSIWTEQFKAALEQKQVPVYNNNLNGDGWYYIMHIVSAVATPGEWHFPHDGQLHNIQHFIRYLRTLNVDQTARIARELFKLTPFGRIFKLLYAHATYPSADYINLSEREGWYEWDQIFRALKEVELQQPPDEIMQAIDLMAFVATPQNVKLSRVKKMLEQKNA